MAKIKILIDTDIFIDALAWSKNLPLVTRNRKHFEQFKEITLVPLAKD